MENNKKELPFVYNVGDRLKYINGNGEMITVSERHRQYDKETGTAKNIYLLTIENYDGCGYMYQKYASEKHMMANMHRVYSPKDPKYFLKKEFNVPKDSVDTFVTAAKYMKYREDNMEDNKRETIFKIGDILEFDANVKGLVACIYQRAAHSEFLYGIWTWDGEVADCDEWLESDLITEAKRVDHMDISVFVGGEENNKPDYKTMLTAYSLVNASNLRHELAAVKNENMELKNENAFLRHRLREVEAQREKVKNERDDVEERTHKREEENEKLMQKISSAEKQLDEAAKRVYEARENLSVILYNRP